jgi:hypothetical protein
VPGILLDLATQRHFGETNLGAGLKG